MKKIVLLSERFPYPPTSGTKNLLYNYCRILHNELGLDVINISFQEQDDATIEKPDFIAYTYVLPNPSGWTKIRNIICKTFVQRKYPLQVSLFWDVNIKMQIKQIIEKENPDYVIADFIRTTEYLKDYNGYKIADLQDLLSLRYERQLEVDLKTVNPYGSYLFRLPKAVQKVLQLSFVKKYVMKTEINLLKDFELDVGRCYDRVMFVAKSEGKQFDKQLGENKALVTPLGVDYDFFSQNLHLEKKENAIAFLGALNVAHNENGIIHFIEFCFPEIQKRVLKPKLYIIGGGASDRLKQYSSDSIVLMGRVPDVRVAVGQCGVFICPLQFGSGIKTKNLEAMAMGIPVVTTTIGAENIGAENGRDWLVADDDLEFSKYVVYLLSDPDMGNAIGANGQRFVKKEFNWDNARNAFKSVFCQDIHKKDNSKSS